MQRVTSLHIGQHDPVAGRAVIALPYDSEAVYGLTGSDRLTASVAFGSDGHQNLITGLSIRAPYNDISCAGKTIGQIVTS